MHSSDTHTVASRALLAGESIDEVAFLLGHRDANVTRAVYVRDLADARRRSMRRWQAKGRVDEAESASNPHDLEDRPVWSSGGRR